MGQTLAEDSALARLCEALGAGGFREERPFAVRGGRAGARLPAGVCPGLWAGGVALPEFRPGLRAIRGWHCPRTGDDALGTPAALGAHRDPSS